VGPYPASPQQPQDTGQRKGGGIGNRNRNGSGKE